VFIGHFTQFLHISFHAEVPCLAALAKLQVGVPWTAADGVRSMRTPCPGSACRATPPASPQTACSPHGAVWQSDLACPKHGLLL
jgi:hypothetical protein